MPGPKRLKPRKACIERIQRIVEAEGCEKVDAAEYITDLLADLRHYCEAHKVDYYFVSATGHGWYLRERFDVNV